MGRSPIAQPPGRETTARPWRATSGPSTSTDARICLTSSYGASARLNGVGSTVTTGGLHSTSAPMKRNRAEVVSMSRSAGTLRKVLLPSARSAEQRMGSAAFLAPETSTVPERARPPSTRRASTRAPRG